MRPSTETRIESGLRELVRVVAGMLMFGFGAVLDGLEYEQPPTHTVHLAMFTAIATLGLVVAFASFILPVMRQVVVIIGPYVPVVGGRRAGDPPASTPTEPPANPPAGPG